jgi:hypothetical protein
MQVMLDKDLAHWYGTETKRLIEQVKRNIDRFPSHFMFQLNDEESSSLRSQIATLNNDNKSHSKRGMHSKYNSYVFTEHGVAMLSSVIKSKIAIQVNIQIINAYIAFRSNSFTPIITNPNDESLKIISRRLDEHQERIQLILNQLNPIRKMGMNFHLSLHHLVSSSLHLLIPIMRIIYRLPISGKQLRFAKWKIYWSDPLKIVF